MPHLEVKGAAYFVTFRLAGSLPKNILEAWVIERKEIEHNAKTQQRPLSEFEKRRLSELYSDRIESYLDKGTGECWLFNPLIAELVTNALKHFNGTRYTLHAWCVMPNHVHVVVSPLSNIEKFDFDLIPILHSWKSFTSHQANKLLKRSGKFWHNEYYDHMIRSNEEFGRCVEYTLQNPVKAGLCSAWQDWKWSGCDPAILQLME